MTLDTDTIAAVATAPGAGALGVVRVSGPRAFEILAAVAPDADPGAAPRTVHLTRIVRPSEGVPVDHALVTRFPAPHSYTGEDVVEISGHGGRLAPGLVLEACLEAGARAAEPGEFTRRAHLRGKLDLVQAEAVLDLVEGRSGALHQAALHHLERGLSARIGALRERLVELEALLVHHIDFPDEDDPPVPLDRIAREGEALEEELGRLAATAPEGELLRDGALAVLAGAPNAGKSSLFNALLGDERVIVTDEPGTTRDAVEASVTLGGYPFRLVDTAGLRSDPGPVERLGIEVALRYLEAADLVIFCVEAGRPLTAAEETFLGGLGCPAVLVRTKADRAGATDGPGAGVGGGGVATVSLSVVSGEGLAALRERLAALAFGGLAGAGAGVPVLTRARQAAGVRRAREEVAAFVQALKDGVPAEMAATHLLPAETALEEVVGVVTREEVLDRLFAGFCIGK